MFQNENVIEKQTNKLNVLANVFAIKNVVIYIISFMLSMVGLGGEFSIFSISMFGACMASSVPVLGVVLVSLLGNLIKYGVGGALGYFLTALVLVVTLLIIKPIYNEKERNEKIKIGKHLWISVLIIQIIKLAMSGFTLYDVLSGITVSIIGLVFYKIFVNATIVLQDFWTKRAFTIEELIGASLILAIAVGAFGNLNLFGFNIKNILSILIVMVLGWKNGILVGTTAGVTIGVTLGVITGSEPIMIAAYSLSGMLAGILNQFGKIGVVIGFALGNVLLAYVSNGYTVELIHFKEILIAFVGLLAVPNNLSIELEEFIGNKKLLPITPDRALNKSKEVAENLNHVSQAIQEMATTYQQAGKDSYDANKQIFITELLSNLEPYQDNMLYEDMADTEGKIIEQIFAFLLDKQEIDRQALLEIFANCNSYIVGFEDKEVSQYLEENISQIVRMINVSYKVAKSDFIWKKRVEENQKNMGKQLDGVSKAIEKMAKGIEEDIQKEGQYEKQKTEIMELLKQRNILVSDISIKKEGRYLLEVFLNEILETAKIETIEKIVTQVLKEKIVLNEEATIGKKLSFLSDDRYVMAIGTGETTKNKSELSGDAMLNVRLKDGKYLVAISDGMGTGTKARQSSTQSLRMLENLLLSGFDKNISLDLINTSLMNQNTEIFATLDIAIIDLYEGNIEFIKSAACPTYIKNNKKVQIIKSNSLPTGMLEGNHIQSFDRDITSGDILVMCSDGILDANIEYKNKELWIKYMLEDIETTNTNKIADLILNEAIDNTFGNIKDDMSIMVCKFKEKED
ncbi:MAG: SpoIIE family protein phosphatase [Clostridia bacterium]|nr:SpoIIE family protein phosphatase [Clostridia bacterium]